MHNPQQLVPAFLHEMCIRDSDKLLQTMKENMARLIEEFEHCSLYKGTAEEMEKCS